jgi:dienelactone hydrolase
MRASLAVLLFATIVSAAEAPPPEAFRVLAEEPAGPRVTPFLQYQLDRAWRQDDKRLAAFAALRSEAELLAKQKAMRAALLDLIGGLPSFRTPLNPRITGSVPMSGYRIEKVIFESQPGLHVTALLYVPDGPVARRPAVLLPCGHAPDGKSFKNYQEIAGQLVARGYVVLSWDPVGQGERSQFWDAAKQASRYNLVCGEHAVLGSLACLAGSTLNRHEVWDGMRAVDYLLTRPEVDPARLSITGTSGGGLQTAWIAALDERIAVVAPSCYVTALPMRMANRIFEDPDSDGEQDPAGLVSSGIDHPGLLALVYPRPLIIASAIRDFVPIEGARRTYREMAALYGRFGKADRLAFTQGYHAHSYSPENRLAAFAFLDRFNGLPVRDSLAAVTLLEPKDLRCTPTGQVRVDLPGRSLLEVIRDDAKTRPRRTARDFQAAYGGAEYPGVADWPVVPERAERSSRGVIAWKQIGTSTAGTIRIERYRLTHSGSLTMPLLRIYSDGASHDTAVLDLALDGKVGPDSWSEVVKLVEAGHDVLSFDTRGAGETRMRYKAESIDDPTLVTASEAEAYTNPLSGVLANQAYNGLLSGRPQLFEMIEDVEIVTRFAREALHAKTLQLVPRGDAALFAEAAAAALRGLSVRGGGSGAFSWAQAVATLRETWPIQYLFPDGAAFDLSKP